MLRVLAAVAFLAATAFSQEAPAPTPAPVPAAAAPAAAAPAAAPAEIPEVAAPAQAMPAPAPAPAPMSMNYKPAGGSGAQLSLYLVLLLALLAGGAYLLRNGFTIFQPKLKGERRLQISETRMLGNRQFLIVAQYEDRKMLIGVCPGRIDYLCTLAGGEPEFPNLSPEKSDA